MKRLSGGILMNNKILNITIFVISIICLIISIRLFWNMAIFADEFNTSPTAICGGDFWLSMDWLRLGLSALLCLLTGINLFKTDK